VLPIFDSYDKIIRRKSRDWIAKDLKTFVTFVSGFDETSTLSYYPIKLEVDKRIITLNVGTTLVNTDKLFESTNFFVQMLLDQKLIPVNILTKNKITHLGSNVVLVGE
jgi:hypothetical protein